MTGVASGGALDLEPGCPSGRNRVLSSCWRTSRLLDAAGAAHELVDDLLGVIDRDGEADADLPEDWPLTLALAVMMPTTWPVLLISGLPGLTAALV